jgi:hypothetical protein
MAVVVPSPPDRHPAAGQGALEYLGVLGVVAAVLVAAGPVAGASELGPRVANVVKTGVCIVAGDVCRAADAEAAGLAPCTLSERRDGNSLAVTLFSIRLSGGGEATIARRSDGRYLVVRTDEGGLAGVAGLGFAAGPLDFGVEGEAGLKVAKATAWLLPDEASTRSLVVGFEGARDEALYPPLWRSGELGLATSGWAGLGARLGRDAWAETTLAGVEVAARTAAGVRIGHGTTTYFIRAQTTGPQLESMFGGTLGTRARGPVVAEYTRDSAGPRELAFRVTFAGAGGSETVETVARLDLRDAESRAVAERLLQHRAPWAAEAAADLREAIRRAAATGTVERSVYAVDDASKDFDLTARAGVEFGASVGATKVTRRLVDASAWTPGSPERARDDCIA